MQIALAVFCVLLMLALGGVGWWFVNRMMNKVIEKNPAWFQTEWSEIVNFLILSPPVAGL